MTTAEREQLILVVRLGAMGDVLHALPAVASLKQSFPGSHLVWVMAPKWMPLVEGNPFVDEVIPLDRREGASFWTCWRRLRRLRPQLAIDFQGLIQSALVSRAARPKLLIGFDQSSAREPLASILYNRRMRPAAMHVVNRNLELVEAAGAGILTRESWIPPGRDHGRPSPGPFVLTNPLAGWKGKQWPLENYEFVARRLKREGLELVANVPHQSTAEFRNLKHVRVHSGSIAGLIAATRQATAVLGLDSGPLHLAAALRKPGVALFGPTDPARNGPYGGSIRVLRVRDAEATYKRMTEIHSSMLRITPEEVAETLLNCIAERTQAAEVPR